jgi:inhibitor of KinA sporulation pathway (predicted exonuclease)
MARPRLDRLVVFDLEETCWDGPPPEGQSAEIVEIGVAELLLDGEPAIGRTMSILVRPVRSSVSAFCTALTGITATEVRRQGRPLAEALATLSKAFGAAGKTWAAWGRDDRTLARDCEMAGLATPAFGGFIDLGAAWGLLAGTGAAPGLDSALAALGLEFEGRRHRATDDAVNTARVAAEMGLALRRRISPAGTPSP